MVIIIMSPQHLPLCFPGVCGWSCSRPMFPKYSCVFSSYEWLQEMMAPLAYINVGLKYVFGSFFGGRLPAALPIQELLLGVVSSTVAITSQDYNHIKPRKLLPAWKILKVPNNTWQWVRITAVGVPAFSSHNWSPLLDITPCYEPACQPQQQTSTKTNGCGPKQLVNGWSSPKTGN